MYIRRKMLRFGASYFFLQSQYFLAFTFYLSKVLLFSLIVLPAFVAAFPLRLFSLHLERAVKSTPRLLITVSL